MHWQTTAVHSQSGYSYAPSPQQKAASSLPAGKRHRAHTCIPCYWPNQCCLARRWLRALASIQRCTHAFATWASSTGIHTCIWMRATEHSLYDYMHKGVKAWSSMKRIQKSVHMNELMFSSHGDVKPRIGWALGRLAAAAIAIHVPTYVSGYFSVQLVLTHSSAPLAILNYNASNHSMLV